MTTWQGVTGAASGLDALLDAVESLQGAPVAASILERDMLPARIEGYEPEHLDTLLAAGEVTWVGVEPLGDRDGRVALYLTDHLARLWRPSAPDAIAKGDERAAAIVTFLRAQGASYFAAVHEAAGGGYPRETVDALWDLAWRGVVSNDSLQPLRAYVTGHAADKEDRRKHRPPAGLAGRPFRSRRQIPPAAEGRWSLVASRVQPVSETEWRAALAQQLLSRYGLVTRDVAAAESISGGFTAVYDVLRSLEERGRIRRGFFVTGVSAIQFALAPALEMLRSLRQPGDEVTSLVLAASDPANPFGTILEWPPEPPGEAGLPPSRGASPRREDEPVTRRTPSRMVGARVVIVDGRLAAWVSRGGRQILTWLPEVEPDRSRVGQAVAEALAGFAREGEGREGGLLVSEVDGISATDHPLGRFLESAGFVQSALGYQVRRDMHVRRAIE